MAVNIGQGTILKIGGNAVFQVVEIAGPDYSVPKVEKTNLADVYRRYRAGLPEVGTATFTLQYDPSNSGHMGLTNAIEQFPQTLQMISILFNTANGNNAFNCNGFISKFAFQGMNQDDNLEVAAEITFDITPVFT
jgi:hypothetical protein